MNLKKLFTFVSFIAMLGLGGCEDFPKKDTYSTSSSALQTPEPSIVKVAYGAIDKLIDAQSIDPKVSDNTLILVSTIQNIDAINQSSTFGRVLSEQMSSRLVQLGVPVNELKMRGSLYVGSQGEQILSREIREVSKTQKADLIIAGTYAIAGKVVYVNVKLIRPDDSRILSAYDFSIPLTPNIRTMLGV